MSSWVGTGKLISFLVAFLGVAPAHCRKGLVDFGADAAAAVAGRTLLSWGG